MNSNASFRTAEMPLQEFLTKRFFPIFLHGKSPGTHQTYRAFYSMFASFFEERYGRPPLLGDLNESTFDEFDSCMETVGYSASTRLSKRKSFITVWNFAYESHYLAHSPLLTRRKRARKIRCRSLKTHYKFPAVSPEKVDPSTLTIKQLAGLYLAYADDYYRNGLGESTRENENAYYTMKHLVAFLGPTKKANGVGPRSIHDFLKWMVEKGFTRQYVNVSLVRVKMIFKWAVSFEYLPVETFQRIQTVSGLRKGRFSAREQQHRLPVPDADFNAVLPFLPPIVADMVRIQKFTGCRVNELIRMRPCDIDRGSEPWRYVPAHHKTDYRGRKRVIFIGPKAAEILAPYLDRDETAECFSPAETVARRWAMERSRRKGNVQPSQRDRRKKWPAKQAGERYERQSYQRAVARACQRAGVKKWTPAQLRHTAATELRKQFGVETAQVILGHSRIDTTEIYAKRNDTLAIHAIQKIG